MNNETVILAGAALVGYALIAGKQKQAPVKSAASTTASGGLGVPGSPIAPTYVPPKAGTPVAGSLSGLSGSVVGLSLNVPAILKKWFGSSTPPPSTPPPSGTVTNPNVDTNSGENSLTLAPIAEEIYPNVGFDSGYNPGPEAPEPNTADNSLDFSQANSNAGFDYVS